MGYNKVTGANAIVGRLTVKDDASVGGNLTVAGALIGDNSGGVFGATIDVSAEDSNVVTITIQLTDENDDELEVRAGVLAYLSDDANGDSVAGTAPDTVAIATDGVAIPLVTGKTWLLISEADGDIGLSVTDDGADTWYLILVIPGSGKLVASAAITVAGA